MTPCLYGVLRHFEVQLVLKMHVAADVGPLLPFNPIRHGFFARYFIRGGSLVVNRWQNLFPLYDACQIALM